MGADGRLGLLSTVRTSLNSGITAPIPRWERRLVAGALSVHAIDVLLDLLVLLLFVCHLKWGFLLASAGVTLGAWLLAAVYFTYGRAGADVDFDGDLAGDRLPRFALTVSQIQIFVEAHHCVFRSGDTDDFFTLRLMQAILEAGPNVLVQTYALVVWAAVASTPAVVVVLGISVCSSAVSFGLGLAMWERKLQLRTSLPYIFSIAVMRLFEVLSRCLTLALFAVFTQPSGMWWVLSMDYFVMLCLIIKSQSVKLSYGLFVAAPLVLVSLEPLVWRWEDHAVAKDTYYSVRILEFALMWAFILNRHDTLDAIDSASASNSVWLACKGVALACTVGLYIMLPLLWPAARRHELREAGRNRGDVEDDGDELLSDEELCSDFGQDSNAGEAGRHGRSID